MSFTPIILIHVAAASAALALGTYVMANRKGTSRHRLVGRVWVALMLLTALSSFGIRTTGSFSWIHLLSLWILMSMVFAVRSIREGDVVRHVRWMRGSYAGLVVAAVFTLLPYRMLGALARHAAG